MSNPRSRGTRSHAFAPPLYDSTNLPTNDSRVLGRLITRVIGTLVTLWYDIGIAWVQLTGAGGAWFNVKEFGAAGDWNGSTGTNDSAAFQAAYAAAAVSGGTVFVPPGWYYVPDLLTHSTARTRLLGAGEASKITCADTDGGIKFTAAGCGIEKIWLHQTGAGGWAIKSDNGKIHNPPSSGMIGRGPEMLVLRDVKVTAAAGAAGGIQLINTWFSSFENISMPGGDGTAIDIQSGGFNYFKNVKAVQMHSDLGLNQWNDGLKLHIQPAQTVDGVGTVYTSQQCDDNLFEDCDFENIDGIDLTIYSAGDGAGPIPGVGPARNVFVRCLFGANTNTYPCVLLNNAWRNTFINCNAEHSSSGSPNLDVWTVENAAQANAFHGCSGRIHFLINNVNPWIAGTTGSYQTIQSNALYDHVNAIEIDNLVWGTKIGNGHGTITNNGQWTRIDRSEIGTAGSLEVTNLTPVITFSDRNTTASGTSLSVYGFHNTPDNAIGSNGDIGLRDNPTAGGGFYQKRDGVWLPTAGYPNRVGGTFTKTGIADNAATAIFTITTTNESGNVDGGAYTCEVRALVTHIATNGAADNAAVKYRGSFTREMIATGTGSNTAVEDTFTGTSVASVSGTRDIASVTMTVTETSEYVQTVNFTVDLNGSDVQTAEVTVFVDLLYTGFLTTPTLALAA